MPTSSLERRAAQRFDFHLPIELSCGDASGQGFTQDISARGMFFFSEMLLEEGAAVLITLRMPSEITLGETMRVRCRGRVLRVLKTANSNKLGVAATFEGYDYLSDELQAQDISGTYQRIAALHEHPFDREKEVIETRRVEGR
jgi:PilZ domain-containing protein